MAKRRSRKSSSSSGSRYKRLKAKSRRSSKTANFFSFVAGLVSSLLLLSIAVAGFRPNDVDEPVDTSTVKVEGDVVVGITDFEKIVADGSANEASRLLRILNDWPKKATLPIKFDYQSKRIAVADRILEIDSSDDQKNFAIQSKIEACSSFYGLDFLNEMNLPAAATQLREASEPFLDHPDEKIRRSAILGMAKLNVFEYARKLEDSKFAPARDSIFRAVECFPDDPFVVDNIRLLVRRLVFDDIDYGRQLIDEFFDKHRDNESSIVRNFAQELKDMLLIADTDYDSLVANRWANGDAGREALLEATVELASNVNGGESLIAQIGTTLSWFEQAREFEDARRICNVLKDTAADHQSPQAAALAKRTGEAGLKRIEMVGKKINLIGENDQGPIDADEYKDRITIVVFFGQDNRSFLTLQRLIELRSETVNRGVQVLAVSTSPTISNDISKLFERTPQLRYMAADDSTPPTNPILEQYPVVQTPNVILLDHGGKVDRISIRLANINTHIEKLINDRRRDGLPQN